MDVVRTNVAKLKGIIEIKSEEGKGTTFTLKLPLTLAIIQGLLVKVSNEVFAIPLSSVLEVVRMRVQEIEFINKKEIMRLRDGVLPLSRMSHVLCLPESETQAHLVYVVVAGWAEQRVGIIVDSLLGQQEIVVKSLGEHLENTPAMAGSTILGDGRPILIVDVRQYMSLSQKKTV